uniref:Uncharacterized protein n=1 Tax=Panagrolaimus sp. ES5 TaxID=591445 RepID=A0AC34FGB4_9BILA
MSFDEFLFISATVEDVDFSNVKISYNNGKIVLLEDIIENFPKLKACTFSLSPREPNISCYTAQRIVQSSNFSNITDFCIVKISEAFDITTFINCVKDHQFPRFWIHIENTPTHNYKIQLDECVDVLINSKIKSRMIQYTGENPDKFTDLFDNYDDDFIRVITLE